MPGDSESNERKFVKKRKKGVKDRPKRKREIEDEEIEKLLKQYSEFDALAVEKFTDFPLSSRTRNGLAENNYVTPTEIQKDCIGLALQGFDILGAAKTGSGKTLAFLVPILEVLFCNKWTKLDGLGALIITPTRELALQIYETLCKVGKHHDFSAGLIIGGKDLHFEKSRMHLVNIIICTPGRLLQHMDENPLFDCSNLKALVLDEADRCLDLGFERTMNCIIENLPPKRQTLLFSATQTKNVKDLVRLSLKDPKFVSVHEHAKYRTPEGLTQSYIVCDQHEKMTFLWSFIKTHLKQKVIIFFSTCNQVRFMYDIMCKLHPRVTLLALQGKLHQLKRMDIYHQFCRKQHAILFATDIAARGLDFPAVNWVVQLDCPENVETYIHRAGRTARFQKGGECLLVLRPTEECFVEKLTSTRIPITEIKVNAARMFSPQAKIEAFLAKDNSLKASAQRAFVSYFKSVFLMKDKTVFDVKSIDPDKYARSLGLVVSPRIRFLQKIEKNKQQKSQTLVGDETENINAMEADDDEEIEPSSHKETVPATFNFHQDGSESEDDVLVMKGRHVFEDTGSSEEGDICIPETKKQKVITKVALAKKALKKKIIPNKKILFTEEGEAIMNKMRERVTDVGKQYEANDAKGGIDIEEAKQVMKEEDRWDRKLFREKLKAKRREERRKRKEQNKMDVCDIQEESGSESEGSEPDLSWLPDPDKIYGKQDGVGASEDSGSEKGSDGSPPSDAEDGLTLQEQEELALKLLSSN